MAGVQRKIIQISLAVTLLVGGLFSICGFIPLKQSEGVKWAEPELISAGVLGQSTFPVIAADSLGRLHVVWRTYIENPGVGSEILFYYTSRIQDTWSAPVDIFTGQVTNSSTVLPTMVISSGQKLNLLWNGPRGLYYSWVEASQASSVRAWSQPELIDEGTFQCPYAIATPDGTLHVAYLRTDGAAGIYYMKSPDQGETWSKPLAVSSTGSPVILPMVSEMVHLSSDNQNRIHIVWSDLISNPAAAYGSGVFYSRSGNNGETWDTPVRIDSDWDLYGSPGAPDYLASIGVDRDNKLFVLWHATYQGEPSCARQQRYSLDSGLTWGPRTRVLEPIEGCLGWMNIATDVQGITHLITIARDGEGSDNARTNLYYSKLLGFDWIYPQRVGEIGGTNSDWRTNGIDRPRMAISQGDVLNIVWLTKNGEIWFVQSLGATPEAQGSPPISPIPQPTIEPTPQVLITLQATGSPETQKPLITPILTGVESSNQFPITVGIISSLILIISLVVYKLLQKR